MRKLNYFLIFVCIATAIAVVWVRHENREIYINLQAHYQERDGLNIEWRRLLLEHAVWSGHEQLESWATENFSMKFPDQQVVLLLPKRAKPNLEEVNR